MKNPKKFLEALGVITLIRNSGSKLKVWDFLATAKNSFPNIRIAQVQSLELKKLEKIFLEGPSFAPHLII